MRAGMRPLTARLYVIAAAGLLCCLLSMPAREPFPPLPRPSYEHGLSERPIFPLADFIVRSYRRKWKKTK